MARDEKRRDPGEFYPGGKVWVKPGQSQPQGRVTWEQIEGKPQIAPLPDRYRDSDVKGKINEIASKFATVVVAALIGWTACADITVQKKRKDQIYNDEQVVVDVSGDGVGMNTNAVIDIANDTIATNPVVAAKLDGPTVAPTNVASSSGKAADAMLTGTALTNRYTKAETDAELAGKASLFPQGERPEELEDGDIYVKGLVFGEVDVMCGTEGDYHSLMKKANRPDTFPITSGNLASLDGNGDLEDSGIAKTEIGAKLDATNESGTASLDWTSNDGYLNLTGNGLICNYVGINGDISMNGGISINSGEGHDVHIIGDGTNPDHYLSHKADVSMISATDETFSNEVATVARTVTPQPSPTLRVYDEILQCWWIGRMVNGVINWEVE